MFTICTRLARTASSQTFQRNILRTPLQVRYSSTQPPGTSSFQIADIFSGQKPPETTQTSEARKPLFHILSQRELDELKVDFKVAILQSGVLGNQALDPKIMEMHWQKELGMVIELQDRYRTELDCLIQLVESKEGEELKILNLKETAKTEAWKMGREIFHDMFPTWAPIPPYSPEYRLNETEKGRALREINCSSYLLSNASEVALKETFSIIWKEKGMHLKENKRRFLWKTVCMLRQDQLEDRILPQMQQIQKISDPERRTRILFEFIKQKKFVLKALRDWLIFPAPPKTTE